MKYLVITLVALMVNAGDFKVEKDLAKNLFLSLESTVPPECQGKKCTIELDQVFCIELPRSNKVKCTVGAFSNGKVLVKIIKGEEALEISDALYDISEATCTSGKGACGIHFYNISCKEETKFLFKRYKCYLSNLKE